MSVSLLVCEVFTFCESLGSVANSTLPKYPETAQCVLSVNLCTKPFIKINICEVNSNSFKIQYFGSTAMCSCLTFSIRRDMGGLVSSNKIDKEVIFANYIGEHRKQQIQFQRKADCFPILHTPSLFYAI